MLLSFTLSYFAQGIMSIFTQLSQQKRDILYRLIKYKIFIILISNLLLFAGILHGRKRKVITQKVRISFTFRIS